VHVLGIDLAASPATTGVVRLEPDHDGRWGARSVGPPADDDQLVEQARGAIAIGIDAPLGWPGAFVEAIAQHHELARWPGTVDRSSLTHRVTDHRTKATVGRLPLSVSADLLGVVGMRCALLQRRWADEVWERRLAPRDGSGMLAETYPAAAFAAWGIACRGYKARQRPVEASAVREAIVEALAQATGDWLALDDIARECVGSDHVLDALVCALVAIAVQAGSTTQPDAGDRAVARREGWIHVPTVPIAALTAPTA
jgi:predicted nuclease with RNAse H fold